MGNIVNPIKLRSGWSRYWRAIWCGSSLLLNRKLYYQDFLVYKYFMFLAAHFNNRRNTFFLFDIKIIRFCNVSYLYIYFFDTIIDELMTNSHWWQRDFFRYVKRYVRNKTDGAQNSLLNIFLFLLVFKFLLYNLKMYVLKILSKHFLYNRNNIQLRFVGMSLEYYDPLLLAWYVRLKLKQRYTFVQVIRPLFRFFLAKLKKQRIVRGLKIQCAGRLSRKERASYLWHNRGKLFSTTISANLGFAMVLIFLHNSVVAVKVWVSYNKRYKQLKNCLII